MSPERCSRVRTARCAFRTAALALAGTWLAALVVAAQTPPPFRPTPAELQAVLNLGSDFSSLDPAEQQRVLNLIDNRGQRLDVEREIVVGLDQADPETPYDQLVAAEGTRSADYLQAAYRSFARHLAAEQARDRDNAARQLRAFQQYVALAADVIEQGLKGDDQELQRMTAQPALRRRPPAAQVSFVARLRSSGLRPEHRDMLRALGSTDAEISAYVAGLLKLNPEDIGTSAADFLADINNVRRQTVARLRYLAAAVPADLTGPEHQTFLVANPHDRTEEITFNVRRASIPPEWKIAVLNADEPDGAKPKYPVTEADPGRRYTIQLPAHEQARVMSVVVPVGRVADDTLATWAIEGMIRDELIGGMMMQRHVPASIPAVQLPPVARLVQSSAGSTARSLPVAAAGASHLARWVIVASFSVLLLLLLMLLFGRRKGHTR